MERKPVIYVLHPINASYYFLQSHFILVLLLCLQNTVSVREDNCINRILRWVVRAPRKRSEGTRQWTDTLSSWFTDIRQIIIGSFLPLPHFYSSPPSPPPPPPYPPTNLLGGGSAPSSQPIILLLSRPCYWKKINFWYVNVNFQKRVFLLTALVKKGRSGRCFERLNCSSFAKKL